MKELRLSDQAELCYRISSMNPPKLHVQPGETVSVETEDAFSGQVRKEGDLRDITKKPYPNPLSGPLYITGSQNGDSLKINVVDIEPLIGQGATRIVSPWYTTKYDSELIQRFMKFDVPHGTRICPIKNGKVFFDKFVLDYRPMIGTIATADPLESFSTFYPGPFGGNMDIPDVTIDATLYLPVRVDGALLHVGDVHAVQGEGELAGAAVEMPSKATLKIDLVKRRPLNWPRLENKDMIFSIAASQSGRTLQDAMRLAFTDLVLWLEEDYHIERWTAFQLLTLDATIRVGNFWTVAVGAAKKLLI